MLCIHTLRCSPIDGGGLIVKGLYYSKAPEGSALHLTSHMRTSVIAPFLPDTGALLLPEGYEGQLVEHFTSLTHRESEEPLLRRG